MRKNDLVFYLWWVYLRYLPIKIKYRIWSKDNLPWWQKPRIRKNESFYHQQLSWLKKKGRRKFPLSYLAQKD